MAYTPRFETLIVRRYNYCGDLTGPGMSAEYIATAVEATSREEADRLVIESLVRMYGHEVEWMGRPKVTILNSEQIPPATNFFGFRSV